MGKRAIHRPDAIDWPQMKRSHLTLGLSRRDLVAMPDDIAERRILIALNEAAHFLITAHDGLAAIFKRILEAVNFLRWSAVAPVQGCRKQAALCSAAYGSTATIF